MVVKMSSPGRSFGGVAEYCLHDPRLLELVRVLPPMSKTDALHRAPWSDGSNLRSLIHCSVSYLHGPSFPGFSLWLVYPQE